MKYLHFFCVVSLITMLMISCCESSPVRIKIVCTSDVHGNFFPYDFRKNIPSSGSLARVSSYLNELKTSSQYGENVIYMDNGDILQGQPTVYFYNTVCIEDIHVAAEALNYLGCDVALLGNHDFETGGPTYQRYMDDLKCTTLGGNVVFEGTEHPFLPPYTVVEREGVRIAVLGLTTPAIPNWLPRNLWRELVFEDMECTASRWMQHIQMYEKPNMVIGLFHSGYDGGIVTEEYAENATRAVAENVPGFDAIFFGHDHRARNEKIVNIEGDTVLLINPANNADKVAVLDVVYVKGNDPEFVIEADLVDMNAYEPDTAYMNYFEKHIGYVEEYVTKKIGVSSNEIKSLDACFGPSGFVDFIHTMQLDITGSQVSFAAPFASDAVLPKGDIHVSDMFNLYRYENMLYVMNLSGREIKGHLEMSYGHWVNQMKSPKDHLLLFEEPMTEGKLRLKNPIYNFDSAAGIIYEVDVTKPVGQRVNIKSMADGKPFDMDAKYRVALNSYRGNGGGELLTLGAGIPRNELEERVAYATDVDLRFYMLNYIEMCDSINPQPLNHWKFIPESWVKSATSRDKASFGNN